MSIESTHAASVFPEWPGNVTVRVTPNGRGLQRPYKVLELGECPQVLKTGVFEKEAPDPAAPSIVAGSKGLHKAISNCGTIARLVSYLSRCSSASFRMPAANQSPPALRMSSTGVSQGVGGSGVRKSSILKSPSASSATPVRLELWVLAVAAAPQNRVA